MNKKEKLGGKPLISFKKRGMWLALGIFCLLALDFFSKAWINSSFDRALFSPFYPYGGKGVFQNVAGIDFCITYVTNRGGAWGVFAHFPYLLLFVRYVLVSFLFVHFLFFNTLRFRDVPFALILSGAVGNLIDWGLYGHVIDFFHFTLWGYSFPVFNCADTMIFCGVVLLMLLSFKGRALVKKKALLKGEIGSGVKR